MKGVYVYGPIGQKLNFGIERKVNGQIKAFNDNCLNFRRIAIHNIKPLSKWQSVLIRLPFAPPYNDVICEWHAEFEDVDFVYIRRQMMSIWRILAIRKIRQRNPGVKIVYEYPTYPYKKEMMKRWFDYPLWLREVACRKFMKRYVDRIVTLSQDEVIDGIKTIPIVNGIDLSLISPITPAQEDGAIHVVGSAQIAWWHGYDRFIQGMHKYYKSGGIREIVFHVVGECLEGEQGDSKLIKMVKECGLEGRVIMHGYRLGAELDEIFNRCHIGLISLATQDKDIYVHSTLKSREYLAKGLPTMATGVTDVFVGTDYKYNLELPVDASMVDMNLVIDFYDKIYGRIPREQIIAEIRSFAERTVDMNITMAPVVKFFKGTD